MHTYICHHHKEDKATGVLTKSKLCITADKQYPSFTNCYVHHHHFKPAAFEIVHSILRKAGVKSPLSVGCSL